MRAPMSYGWKNHLCGSTVTESASSSPGTRQASRALSLTAPPYAPSTCSHIPCCVHSPTSSPTSSTAPRRRILRGGRRRRRARPGVHALGGPLGDGLGGRRGRRRRGREVRPCPGVLGVELGGEQRPDLRHHFRPRPWRPGRLV